MRCPVATSLAMSGSISSFDDSGVKEAFDGEESTSIIGGASKLWSSSSAWTVLCSVGSSQWTLFEVGDARDDTGSSKGHADIAWGE